MPKDIITTVYTLNELDEKAKDKARDWFRSCVMSEEWWTSTFEDAEQIGLHITSFNFDRGELDGDLKKSAKDVAAAIIANHGETCTTYASAKEYLDEYEKIVALDDKIADGDFKDALRADLTEVFSKNLCNNYRKILSDEYEYQMSDTEVDEGICANEYTFTANGKRFG